MTGDDERVALALSALAEVVEPAAVGPLIGASAPVPGVVDLRFATTQPGYDGWFWTVSTSELDGIAPTVLEVQLEPGEGALVAPPWVPWEERLAEWRRTHPDGPGDAGVLDDDSDDEDPDEDPDEDDDLLGDDDEDDLDLDEDEDLDLDDDEDVDGSARNDPQSRPRVL